MASKLIKLYEDALDYCSMSADEDGAIAIGFVFDKDEKIAVKIDSKVLLLPTEENLKSYHPDKTVIFHPLIEFINRGESDIVKLMRNQLNVRINYTVFAVATALLRISASPGDHRKLTPEQRELLLQVPVKDAAIIERFTAFTGKRFAEETNRFFTNIYLKKAGTFKGQQHARVGVVQFPIYELLKQDEKELKLKKGDCETFSALLSFIFPGSDTDTESYNNFSDSKDAPWLSCLFKTASNLTDRLNTLLEIYADFIPEWQDYIFNMDWSDTTEGFDDFDYYRKDIAMIPVQKGNEGSLEKAAPSKPAVEAPVVAPERVSPLNLAPKPAPAPAPVRPMGYPPAGYPPPGYPPAGYPPTYQEPVQHD